MKTIKNWRDLEEYGIANLTGEACKLGLRYLCDLNSSGIERLNRFFGCEVNYASPWNSKVDGCESKGSIMLPRNIFQDLAPFCLYDRWKDTIFVTQECGEFHAYSPGDREMMQGFVDRYEKYNSEDQHKNIEEWQQWCIRRHNDKVPKNKQVEERFAVWSMKDWGNLDLLSKFSFLKQFLYFYVHENIVDGGFHSYAKLDCPGIGLNATHAMSGRTMIGGRE